MPCRTWGTEPDRKAGHREHIHDVTSHRRTACQEPQISNAPVDLL